MSAKAIFLNEHLKPIKLKIRQLSLDQWKLLGATEQSIKGLKDVCIAARATDEDMKELIDIEKGLKTWREALDKVIFDFS